MWPETAQSALTGLSTSTEMGENVPSVYLPLSCVAGAERHPNKIPHISHTSVDTFKHLIYSKVKYTPFHRGPRCKVTSRFNHPKKKKKAAIF